MKYNKINHCRWVLPIETNLKDLQAKLKQLGCLTPSEPERHEFKLYDSFPNDLWFSKWFLTREGDDWLLSDPEGDWVTGHSKFDNPKYWWEFEGEIKTPLQSHLHIRGLSYKMSLRRESRLIDLKNDDDKTIMRINSEEHFVQVKEKWQLLQKIIELQPLRGYEDDAEAFIEKIDQLGWQRGSESMVKLAYQTLGTTPQPYQPKPKFNLNENDPAHQVISKMTCKLMDIMRMNEEGIINDIDTEFLHDYRVSLRRIRSLLSQAKGAFSEAKTFELKNKFSALGQQTNLMRDLDVYLLSKEDYLEMLPKSLKTGAEIMFEDFTKQRTVACQKLKKFLESQVYKKDMESLELFFRRNHENNDLGPKAQHSIKELSDQRISSRYKAVRKWASRIHEGTPDEEIHELRILCKKLRYLIEFFESLYPKKRLKELVAKLKALQDCLGLFNDYSVQQEKLLEYSHHHQKSPASVHLAIGGMVSVLGQKQIEVRYQVFEQLKKFSATPVRKEFETLFNFSKRNIA